MQAMPNNLFAAVVNKLRRLLKIREIPQFSRNLWQLAAKLSAKRRYGSRAGPFFVGRQAVFQSIRLGCFRLSCSGMSRALAVTESNRGSVPSDAESIKSE